MSRKRKPRRHRQVTPYRLNPLDALVFAGVSVLGALAVGGSPDKALDFGIEALRALGARFIPYEPEDEEHPFMAGLA